MLNANQISYPLIIGHRGYHSKYPENTICSFQAAADHDAQMIELDVTLTKDRQIVVIHDDTLERTTNGQGAVCDHTLSELQQLDAGCWFHPCFSGERLPLLSEVLDLMCDQLLINIEIKPYACEKGQSPDSIEYKVMQLVRDRKIVDRILISSFSGDILQRIAQKEKGLSLALLSNTAANEEAVAFCRKIDAFSWHPAHKIVTADQVNLMQTAGIRVFPFSVDTLSDLQRVIDLGVDGVFTSDPLMVKEWAEIQSADPLKNRESITGRQARTIHH